MKSLAWGAYGPQLSGQDAIQVLADIYANWVPREQILTTNLWSLGRCIQQLSGDWQISASQ